MCDLPNVLATSDTIWVKKKLDMIWVNFVKLSKIKESFNGEKWSKPENKCVEYPSLAFHRLLCILVGMKEKNGPASTAGHSNCPAQKLLYTKREGRSLKAKLVKGSHRRLGLHLGRPPSGEPLCWVVIAS
jgi:hypothetical protein